MKKIFLKKTFSVILTICFVGSISSFTECKRVNKKPPQIKHSSKIDANAQKLVKHNKSVSKSKKVEKAISISNLKLIERKDVNKKKSKVKQIDKNTTEAQAMTENNKNLSETNKIGNIFCGDLKDFISKKTGNNSVLLFEFNPYHHECLPGYAKYFLELGYDVDVLSLDVGIDSFCIFDKTDRLKIYSYKNTYEILNNQSALSTILNRYKYVFLNTIDWGDKKAFNCLDILELPQAIVVSHLTDTLKNSKYEKLLERNRVVTLGEFGIGTYVNPHYFGQIPRTEKNSKTNFVVVGNVQSKRRNYNQLMEAVEKLSEKSLDFKITVFGRGSKLNVPEEMAEYLEFKGQLSYKDMYEEIEKADFILMLIDPKCEQHLKYKTKQVTGNAQLSYGFNKPVIINEEFADFYHFNSGNSIIEENGDLSTAMEKAISCSKDEYIQLQDNLKITADKIFEKSLENLRTMTSPK